MARLTLSSMKLVNKHRMHIHRSQALVQVEEPAAAVDDAVTLTDFTEAFGREQKQFCDSPLRGTADLRLAFTAAATRWSSRQLTRSSKQPRLRCSVSVYVRLGFRTLEGGGAMHRRKREASLSTSASKHRASYDACILNGGGGGVHEVACVKGCRPPLQESK
eukprot:CAMPEP_0195597826 /NCGR_PEP_ID=MMETSP0815-20121206/3187_1 /TAXON_ID=97485 /ORGANISM="Prymnesium parvum, Strain Texoma1" /LENGTH=161 /DNA_ID=CAMNT_0040737183 /DNA_START=228 /DNA_END=711 /DNA_ORIENTATION=+